MVRLPFINFSILPKVELHLHLDCSLSFNVVSAIDPSITLSEFEHDFIAPAKCINLADYLTRAIKGFTLMQTEHQLRMVTADLFAQLRQDNVVYAEIRFAPLLHTQNGLTAEEVVEIVDDEVVKQIAATGVQARLILCTLRHFSSEQSIQTVHLVKRFQGRQVVALDIAGNEASFPVDAHIPAFQYAVANNIHRTAHAGEARGADSVWETLKHFQPTRIGHGVRSIEDLHLVRRLKTTCVHLEVCPTSNVQTNVFKSHDDHSIDRLYKAGISVSVNTDARTMSNISLADEYQTLNLNFGWSFEHFLTCNLNAIDASFLPPTMKLELVGRLTEAYKKL